jgi:ribosomal protein L30/L7E
MVLRPGQGKSWTQKRSLKGWRLQPVGTMSIRTENGSLRAMLRTAQRSGPCLIQPSVAAGCTSSRLPEKTSWLQSLILSTSKHGMGFFLLWYKYRNTNYAYPPTVIVQSHGSYKITKV